MVATTEPRMANRKGGRPKKDEGGQATRHIRVFPDLADMIGEIIDLEGGSVANLVDPWLRAHVLAKYTALKPQIDRMKRARQEAQKKKAE